MRESSNLLSSVGTLRACSVKYRSRGDDTLPFDLGATSSPTSGSDLIEPPDALASLASLP